MNTLFLNNEQKNIDLHGFISNPTIEQIAEFISLHIAIDDHKNTIVKLNGKTHSVKEIFEIL